MGGENIKTQEGRQTRDIVSRGGIRAEHGGDEKKEQGIQRATIKRGKGDEAQRSPKSRGEGVFKVQRSNLSLVPASDQNLQQLLPAKLLPCFPPFPVLPPAPCHQQRGIVRRPRHSSPPVGRRCEQHPRTGGRRCSQRKSACKICDKIRSVVL